MSHSGAPQSGSIPLAIAIHRYFDVSLYLLVLTGFGALASTGQLDLPTVGLVGSALLFRGYGLARRRTVVIPERWTNYLTFVYIAFYAADFFLISGSFLTASAHLVLFLMVVRLFSLQRDRDHYFLAVLSFLMVLAAAVLTVDSVFLLAFAAFMLMAVVTFVLMEMRRTSRAAAIQAKESNDPLAYRHMAFALAGAAPVIMLLILLGAAGIFFVLPRISAGYLSAYASGSELSAGFSEKVQLGRIGQIQQSSAVVMHIQIDGDTRGVYDLKWRGVALSLFDGKSWSNPHAQVLAQRLADGRFLLSAAQPPWQNPRHEPPPKTVRMIHYRVLMEPLGTNVFFLVPTPQTLEGAYRMVSVDGAGAVFDLDPERPVSRYEADSNIAEFPAAQLRAASGPIPSGVLLTYLQLPPLDPRIPRLAAQVTASADNNYDKAAALERHLMTSYGYTLQLLRTPPPDPLAHFLFERKQGHCEYFASAMAVMLRTLRIPARIVNGFRAGEFNDLTSNYVVRAAHAHSWVEAYFPGYGWVSFDPTPAGPAETRRGWSRVALYLDALASFWREWVINYDSTHQKTLGQEATRGSRQLYVEMRQRARRHYQALLVKARGVQHHMAQAPRRWSAAAVSMAVLLLGLVNARWLLRSLRRRQLAAHPERSPGLAASIWYARMTRSLARRGWPKSPVQTPEEFVAAIEDVQLRAWVEQFTRHYENARFGDSAADACRLPALYREIASHR